MKESLPTPELDPIATRNWHFLEANLPKFLRDESIGGNASWVEIEGKKYSCAAANGKADLETGTINEFGNYLQPKDGESELTLRVAHHRFRFFKIVGFYGAENFPPQARKAIEDAIEKYNEAHASESE